MELRCGPVLTAFCQNKQVDSNHQLKCERSEIPCTTISSLTTRDGRQVPQNAYLVAIFGRIPGKSDTVIGVAQWIQRKVVCKLDYDPRTVALCLCHTRKTAHRWCHQEVARRESADWIARQSEDNLAATSRSNISVHDLDCRESGGFAWLHAQSSENYLPHFSQNPYSVGPTNNEVTWCREITATNEAQIVSILATAKRANSPLMRSRVPMLTPPVVTTASTSSRCRASRNACFKA